MVKTVTKKKKRLSLISLGITIKLKSSILGSKTCLATMLLPNIASFRRLKGPAGETLVTCLLLYYLISVVLGSNVHILLPVAFSGNLSRTYLMSKLGTQSENTSQLFRSERLG